mgnify:CR=1 FL=1
MSLIPKKGTVYVVDDDEAVRDSLQWLLEGKDYRVRCFESAESFLKGFKDEAVKRTEDIEKQVSAKVSKTMKKAAKEFGFVTMEQYEQLLERLALVEEHAGITQPEHIGDDQAEEGEDNHNHDNEGNGDSSGSKKKKNKRAEG